MSGTHDPRARLAEVCESLADIADDGDWNETEIRTIAVALRALRKVAHDLRRPPQERP